MLLNLHTSVRVLRDSFVFRHFLWSPSLFAQDKRRGRNGDRHPPSPACPRTVTCPGAATNGAAGQTDTRGTFANAVGVQAPGGHGTDKDLKQQQPQYRPLRNTTCRCSPLGHRATDRSSLSVTILLIPNLSSGPSIKSTSLQFRCTGVVWTVSKALHKPTVSDILPCCLRNAGLFPSPFIFIS